MVEHNQIQKTILRKTIVGEKFDKQDHLATLIDIGQNPEGKKIYLQKNLTSKNTLTLEKKTKIHLNTKYEYKKSDKVFQNSYETPWLLKISKNNEMPLVKETFFDEDDIRYLIENGLYPNVGIGELFKYTTVDDMFIDQIDFNNPKQHIIKNVIMLEAILRTNIKKNLIINNTTLSTLELSKKISKKLSVVELEAIERFNLMNQLDPSKKIFIKEVKKGIKTLKLIDSENLGPLDEADIKYNHKNLIEILNFITQKYV